MQADRYLWREWSRHLHHWGVQDKVATLIEAAGPLNLLASQLLYLFQPFAGAGATSRWQALAEMLENEEESQQFAAFLREEEHS